MADDATQIDLEQALAHAAWVRRLARSLLFDQGRVDDVVQQTWMVALRRRPRAVSQLRGWLGGIVRNLVRQEVRSRERRVRRERAAAGPEGAPDPADLAARAETHRRVVEAVLGLAEPYRSTVLLRYFEDLSAEQISRRQGLPGATVRSRLKRALEQLRGRLDEEHAGQRRAWSLALSAAPIQPLAAAGASSGMPWSLLAMNTKTKLALGSLVVLAAVAITWKVVFQPGGAHPVTGAGQVLASPTRPMARTATPDEAFRSPAEPLLGTAGALGDVDPAAPPEVAGATRGSLRVSVQWSDGRPAAGVQVRMIEADRPNGLLHAVNAVVPASGVLRYGEILPGKIFVSADRGGQALGDVLRGEVCEILLTIPPGRLVRGQVLDEREQPAAGAEIWLSDYFNYTEGRVVTHSNEGGRFRIESVGDNRYVGARRAGYQPSSLRLLQVEDDDLVVLALRVGGAQLRGRVVDREGHAVEAAIVLIGGDHGWRPRRAGGDEGPPPVRTRSDSEGAFALGGLPVGPTTLASRARGFTTSTRSLRLDPSSPAEVEIVLDSECLVSGVVSSTAGGPIPDVAVEHGDIGDFNFVTSRTDASGRYAMRGLPAGSAYLTASHQDYRDVSVTLDLSPDQDVSWSPILEAGGAIEGILRDVQSGEPVEGWIVAATRSADTGAWVTVQSTDASGRFSLGGLAPGAYGVVAQDPNDEFGIPAAWVRDVEPGGEALVIEIDANRPAQGGIQGSLVDPSGAVVERAVVSVRHATLGGTPRWQRLDEQDGSFEFEHLPAGSYRLGFRVVGFSPPRLADILVEDGVVTELGELRVEAGGVVVAEVIVVGGVETDAVRLRLVPDGAGFGARIDREGSVFRSRPAATGSYWLCVGGEGVAVRRHAVDVVAGEERSIRVRVRPGVPVDVTLTWPGGERVRAGVALRVQDQLGEVVWSTRPFNMRTESLVHRFSLEPGSYRLTARDGSGVHKTVEFSALTLDRTQVTVDMQ